MNKPLRISRLTEYDFMKIRALDIQPGNRALIILRGPNEAGKTSGLRGIIAALGGKRNDPDNPIRAGEEGAFVSVTLADDVADRLRATVKWTPNGRYLDVFQLENGQELKLPAGQSVIDALVGALAFNALKFMQAPAAEQFAMLMQAIGKADAYKELRARRQKFYEDRTVVNRELKTAEQLAAAKPDPAPSQDLEPVSTDALQQRLREADALNRDIEAYRLKLAAYEAETHKFTENRKAMQAEIVQLELRVEELRAALLDADKVLLERNTKILTARAKLAEMRPTSMDDTAKLVADANAQNERVRAQQEARELQARAIERRREAERLSAAIAAIDNEITTLVTHSDLAERIPGLSISETEITHNAQPISQASGMRQLELSALIGMAINRQARVMAIDEGDRLDKTSLQRLVKLAEQHDYQVWMTAAYAGDGVDGAHIVEILDGLQTNGNTPPAKPKTRKPVATVSDPEVAQMYALPDTATPTPVKSAVLDLDTLEL